MVTEEPVADTAEPAQDRSEATPVPDEAVDMLEAAGQGEGVPEAGLTTAQLAAASANEEPEATVVADSVPCPSSAVVPEAPPVPQHALGAEDPCGGAERVSAEATASEPVASEAVSDAAASEADAAKVVLRRPEAALQPPDVVPEASMASEAAAEVGAVGAETSSVDDSCAACDAFAEEVAAQDACPEEPSSEGVAPKSCVKKLLQKAAFKPPSKSSSKGFESKTASKAAPTTAASETVESVTAVDACSEEGAAQDACPKKPSSEGVVSRAASTTAASETVESVPAVDACSEEGAAQDACPKKPSSEGVVSKAASRAASATAASETVESIPAVDACAAEVAKPSSEGVVSKAASRAASTTAAEAAALQDKPVISSTVALVPRPPKAPPPPHVLEAALRARAVKMAAELEAKGEEDGAVSSQREPDNAEKFAATQNGNLTAHSERFRQLLFQAGWVPPSGGLVPGGMMPPPGPAVTRKWSGFVSLTRGVGPQPLQLRLHATLLHGDADAAEAALRSPAAGSGGGGSSSGVLRISHRVPFADLARRAPSAILSLVPMTNAQDQAQCDEYARYFGSKERAGVAHPDGASLALYVVPPSAALACGFNYLSGVLPRRCLLAAVAPPPGMLGSADAVVGCEAVEEQASAATATASVEPEATPNVQDADKAKVSFSWAATHGKVSPPAANAAAAAAASGEGDLPPGDLGAGEDDPARGKKRPAPSIASEVDPTDPGAPPGRFSVQTSAASEASTENELGVGGEEGVRERGSRRHRHERTRKSEEPKPPARRPPAPAPGYGPPPGAPYGAPPGYGPPPGYPGYAPGWHGHHPHYHHMYHHPGMPPHPHYPQYLPPVAAPGPEALGSAWGAASAPAVLQPPAVESSAGATAASSSGRRHSHRDRRGRQDSGTARSRSRSRQRRRDSSRQDMDRKDRKGDRKKGGCSHSRSPSRSRVGVGGGGGKPARRRRRARREDPGADCVGGAATPSKGVFEAWSDKQGPHVGDLVNRTMTRTKLGQHCTDDAGIVSDGGDAYDPSSRARIALRWGTWRTTVHWSFDSAAERLHFGVPGASTPAVAAAIQFTTLGPGYFVYLGILGSPVAAVAAGAVTESFIVYGPNTRNAQLVHNMFASDEKKVKVRPFRAMGPGFTALVLRNSCASAGIRVLSTPFSQVLACFSGSEPGQIPGICRCGGDFLASVVCGAASMPFNQLLNFQVTSAECLASSPTLRLTLGMQFLKSQYLVTSGDGKTRLSRMVLRDGTLRALYIGLLFSSYAAVERAAIYLASR
ncbi:unnamed protein product [Polarella glacialis]|uniref:Spen paralogue and orthologue SPOC C-terminal domain-containing protein n=1 Tax=Polarella glacialis TaxID=89957 RepID=A0A813E9W6_POLGL|nr:unnamed protein product [Polarella glacialis]